MSLKGILKSVEGIAVLASFIIIILTGSKIFAYLGLVAYLVVNITGGIEVLKKLGNEIITFLKSFKK